MGKIFVVDISKCNGCYSCQLACKDEHCGNDWTPYAKPQPDTGQFWLRLVEHARGKTPLVKVHYMAELCNHCESPACLEACKNAAWSKGGAEASKTAIYKRDDGLVIIDPEKCCGCGECAKACPYDAIFKNEELGIYQKCTGCAHLLDNGYKQPRCVESCPTDALVFGEEEELSGLIKDAEVRKAPGTDPGPKVYYKNVPGQFIGGTVYDPVEKEVVIGAKCRAVSEAGEYETTTDYFGDFIFKDLSVGKWDIEISAEKYETKSFKALDTTECISLGDIPLKPI